MFKFIDLQRKCCITCQHFRGKRKVEVIGRQVFIDYESNTGACGVYNNFPKIINEPANMASYCRYKRWTQLPD
ncbi:MAG: hypothetical protein IJW23_07255 [Lentisphaeria bacterium]|nr:hypothetical protein [Lentisphaeria bacterium]